MNDEKNQDERRRSGQNNGNVRALAYQNLAVAPSAEDRKIDG